jgi:hypothetical protein
MTHTFKLARRAARFRAVAVFAALLGAVACNSDRLGPNTPGDPLSALNDSVALDSATGLPIDSVTGLPIDPATGLPIEPVDGDTLSDAQAEANEALPLAAFASTGKSKGIAFGHFDMPKSMYSRTANGAVYASGPGDIIRTLEAARRSGARVVIRMSGGEKYFRNHSSRTLNLAKWKARIARFKKVNLQPYIKDGTLLGHYILDEPHNTNTWKGGVPFATVEAMAKYSKQLWPGLTTVVRAYPDWLSRASFRWNYLDAAWAQYSGRKGEVKQWMRTQSKYARQEGLGLIVGLNVLMGGDKTSKIKGWGPGGYGMSASQIKNWGSVLASDSHSCAFLSWKYDAKYWGRAGIKAAIASVAAKAQNRANKSCRT